MSGVRSHHFPWRMWIPACLAVTVVTAMTGSDLYHQMHKQMVEVAEQATTIAVGQLAAILSAAEELLRSTDERLREAHDILSLAEEPGALDDALGDIEAIIHGIGFAGLAAIDRSGKVIAVASDDALLDFDFSDEPFVEQAFTGQTFALAPPAALDRDGHDFLPLVYGVTSEDDGKTEPLFLLMTEIDVHFLDQFQSRLSSSLVEHVALLDKSGDVIVGSWPFSENDAADVDIRRGVGGFDLIAAAGFKRSKIFSNLISEFLLLTLTYLTAMLAITALSYAYAYRAQLGEILGQMVTQKDLLHREAQHRVGGALQLISSLVSLQSREAQNERVSQALETIKHRIAAILAVNSRLSGEVDDGQVDLGVYLRSICDDLATSFEEKSPGVRLHASFSSLTSTGEKAVRLGLIMNELVTNAFRHAFDAQEGGTVSVQLAREGERFRITVADDGGGMPDVPEDPGIGLELVSLLTEQLKCSLDQVTGDKGLTWTIEGAINDLAKSGSVQI